MLYGWITMQFWNAGQGHQNHYEELINVYKAIQFAVPISIIYGMKKINCYASLWSLKIKIEVQVTKFNSREEYSIYTSITNKYLNMTEQANSKNCGPPPGNKFDLEVGQRSRSPHGINRKVLSQGSCMPNINALSLILQKIWARLKFLWQTDGLTDGLTDRRRNEF